MTEAPHTALVTGAARGIGHAIAQALARDGHRVAVADIRDDEAAATADSIEAMRRAVPMRRLATPDDIAAAVAFLASDRAGFIPGQTLSVSGGLTMA